MNEIIYASILTIINLTGLTTIYYKIGKIEQQIEDLYNEKYYKPRRCKK